MRLAAVAIALFLVWFLQGLFVRKFWNRGLEVFLDFQQTAAVEGETAALKEVIVNRKFLPLPVLHVKFQMGRELVFTDTEGSHITDRNYRSDIFSCMPWQEIRRRLEFVCRKRGYYVIRSADLVSYDLFQTGHFVSSVPAFTWMYVYPGPADPLRLQLPLQNLLGQVLARQALLRDPFEVQSVRPYQSYDSYRDINWKATAHTGSMKVHVYAPTSSWRVMFLLDVESDRIWEDADLTEEAIRLCGSMAGQLLKEGVPVSICSNGLDCLSGKPSFLEAGAGAGHQTAVMEILARIQLQAAGRLSMEELLRQLSARPSDLENSLFVLLSPVQREELAAAYGDFCAGSPGSQWILPLRPGERPRFGHLSGNLSLFPWEVPYDRS